jgi:hypothetical protein
MSPRPQNPRAGGFTKWLRLNYQANVDPSRPLHPTPFLAIASLIWANF